MADSAADFVTPLAAGYIGGAASGSEMREAMHDIALNQRVQSISDMFGARPPSFEQYREESGKKTNWGKALAYAVGGAALASAAAFGLTALIVGGIAAAGAIAATSLVEFAIVGASGALIGAGQSAQKDRDNAMVSYESHLSDFANRARAAHDSQLSRQSAGAAAQDSPAPQSSQWADSVTQRRNEPVKQGGIA